MPSFNLVDHPWLPCVTPDGSGIECSLRDALLQAHEHRELFDPSPLVNVGLHRLLLGVLHRAFNGPADIEEWRDIWQAKWFDPHKVNAYLDERHSYFDLFDAERPFYQVPFISDLAEPKKWSPISRLVQEAAAGNNATLFDHCTDAEPRPVSPAEAARYVVAMQAFAVGGGVSKPFNFGHGPITRGFTLLALGGSLFETLALNLVVYNELRPIPRGARPDLPAWEQQERPVPRNEGSLPAGYLDYLTWQSRQIHLIPQPDSTVQWCQVRQQMKLPPDAPIDPFKSYLIDPKAGRSARTFRRERALWRDSSALLAQTQATPASGTYQRPELIEWLAEIEEAHLSGLIDINPLVRLAALGLSTEQGKAASVILWRREELPLPLRLLALPEAISKLAEALAAAELVGRVLNQSARNLADLLLTPMCDDKDAHKADPDQARALARALALEQRYWPRLDAHFAELITTLPADRTPHPDDPTEFQYGAKALPVWAKAVRKAAEDSFDETAASLDRSARALKAVAAAQGRFRGSLNRALAPLEESDRREEEGEAA
jgi:CRISPR system Cascade subunit CasA